ncbi:zinc-finger of the FCS-type, C2-C2 [Ancistrocladus abbreviatus]
MLRKRSRPVASKQTIAPDHCNFPSNFPEKIQRRSSFFFNSPKNLKGLLGKYSSETQPMMSSTSISMLESKPFSALLNPFPHGGKIPTKTAPTFSGNRRYFWDQTDHKGIGLALIDSLVEDQNADASFTTSKQKRKLVVFGSQLKIQVPVSPPTQPNSSLFPSESPYSPPEFGIKTPKSNLQSFGKTNCEIQMEGSSGLIGQSLSMEEIELSEDYTCVISHGPNPKTTRIFGNCVLERCCGVVGSPAKKNGKCLWSEKPGSSSEKFLRFCHHCKEELCQGKDIYMYRGEKAFCSQECRSEEMLFDGVEN